MNDRSFLALVAGVVALVLGLLFLPVSLNPDDFARFIGGAAAIRLLNVFVFIMGFASVLLAIYWAFHPKA
ncbi:MAG: hypothetical protein FJ317_02260 [SAR202 cluster bacterium]|nr:hypothetical protein [SAR202 cluster bacterium]